MKTLFTFLLSFLSFYMHAQVSANAGPDKEICILDTLKLTATGLNGGDTGSYQWKDLNTNSIISTSASFSAKITTNAVRNYALQVTRKTYNTTYYAYDTMKLEVNALPTFNFKGLSGRCYNDGAINLTVNQIAVARSADGTTQSDVRYFQKNKNPSWITGGPVGVSNYIYNYPKFLTNAQIPKAGLRDTVCYDFTDSQGCYNYECKPLRLNPVPVVQTMDGIFCQKAGPITLDKLVIKPFSKVGGVQTFYCLEAPAGVDPSSVISMNTSTVPNTHVLDIGTDQDRNRTGEYVVEYCFTDVITGCRSCDTSNINVIDLPKLKFSNFMACINHPLTALDSFVKDDRNGKRLPFATWQAVEYGGSRDMSNPSVAKKLLNSVKSKKLFDPSSGAGQYMLKVQDSSVGCPVSDSMDVIVNGLPVVSINVPDTVCANSAPFALNNVQPAGAVGTWSGKGVSGRNFDPSTSPETKQYEGPVMLKYTYTNPLTTCTSSDSQSLLIQSAPKFIAHAVPHSGMRYMVDFSFSNSSFLDTNKASITWLFNGNTSTYAEPKNIYYADSGTYKAYVYVNSGLCGVVDSVVFTLDYKTVSIADISRLVSIYPNPVNKVFHVSMPFDAGIAVYDINGQSVMTKNHAANIVSSFDMTGLSPGIYLIAIRNNEQVVWKKLVLE